MESLISFHGNKSLKEDIVNEMVWHYKQDHLVKGSYNKDGKFCAIGCGVESLNRKRGLSLKHDNHATYSEALGIPEWLARLEDTIFEGLEEKEAKKFPVEFLEAIPLGVDLEPIQFKFKKFLLLENHKRVSELKTDDKFFKQEIKDRVLSAIDQCLDVMDGAIKTGKINKSAAESAESAARSAWSAAWSARSAAWSAAWSADRSAAWSARSAAESAAWSARSAAFSRYKIELLRLLREA